MDKPKYCIFHVPNYIPMDTNSGSYVRPRKMLDAFRQNGYIVDVVMGYGAERKKQIETIKHKIQSGREYDFLYSESSTMPTLLTEKDHIPRYPFLDFGFLAYCKKQGIKIGLYYRDVHWQYEKYKENVPWYKRLVSIPMYKYDLKKYLKLLDVLYLPSKQMKKNISNYPFPNVGILPPGAPEDKDLIEKRKNHFASKKEKDLKIFYVGGITGIYDLRGILGAIKDKESVYMTICCRENEWNANREFYAPYLTERITIVHGSGDDLRKFYLEADICSCYFPVSGYMEFAVPIKLFEYIGNVTPVIATRGTVAGEVVEKYGNGLCLTYDVNELSKKIEEILNNRELLLQMHENACKCLKENTWSCRALQVEKDLSK